MNKLLTATVMTASLLLLDMPEAAAHGGIHDKHYRTDKHYSRHYDRDYRPHRRYHKAVKFKRSKNMPYWLERDRSFRHWYRHSMLRKDRRISWNRLFDIYRYELRVYRPYRY